MCKFALEIKFILAFITLLLLTSCGGNPSQNTQPDVQIQVDEVTNNSISLDETIHINNCGGKADSKQLASRSFSTNIEGMGGIKIGYEIIEGNISAKYGQVRNITKSRELTAPPGTDMEIVLRWSEEEHAGNVIVNGTKGTYKANIPIAVEQVSSRDLGCPSNVQLVSQPTAAPVQPTQPTPDCWQTVWSFNPSSPGDITSLLSPPRVGYKASFDTSIYADGPGSLRLETTKIIKDPMQDPNSWAWMDNTQTIPAKNGLYRVTAMIRTQDVVATHISVVGRDRNGKDVFQNGTNQVSVVPVVAGALNYSNDWNLYTSSEFNPKEWSNNIEYIMIGVNAGWSLDGKISITWFDNIQLQYCNR